MTKETLDSLLKAMLQSGNGISDFLFVAGKPPVTEDHGKLTEFPIETAESVLTPQLIEEIATVLIGGSERLLRDFATEGSCDCSYSLQNLARFRVNVFKQNGRHAIVMRKLESEVPSLDSLALPAIFREIVREKNGIIFVTGATGSGKTTTLAAMLNELNQTQDLHVVTLEDPIEFYHTHKRCVFSQRELGKDFPDYASGLRAALRQAPKVILVGEIRDRASMEIALSASETGHVVFTTLHTVNAGQTINRIIGMFGKEEEQQFRQRLADTVRYIVSQRLVSKIGGGRLLVSEIMGSSLRTRETLLYGEGENRTFQEIIEAATDRGWHSFDQSLLKAYEVNLITEDTATIFCTHKNKMRRDIDMVKKIRGAEFEMPSGLKLQQVIATPKEEAVI
ncbi:MAG TPA: PilT/PilU family type 4a pilus ATPase [Chthoniobacterales bacterium]|nr:PilT/PilU family type 4a pilus ATPase [Chthoniobacterales bacterium]